MILNGDRVYFCKAFGCKTQTSLGGTYCNEHSPVNLAGNDYVECAECGNSNILFYGGFYKCGYCGKAVKVNLIKVPTHA